MKKTAIVVAPGRGTYNAAELGYLARHHTDQRSLIDGFDLYRKGQEQIPVSTLDGAVRFEKETHTRGDNASALIFACAYLDFLAIDREQFEIVAVTGNSMGWYSALTCAGALDPIDGFRVVNTMGTLLQEKMIGGQLVYPFVDENWVPIRRTLYRIFTKMVEIDAKPGHDLTLSIDLGGMIVLAGNEKGLAAFEAEMPKVDDRYPLRLPNHAAFHTPAQALNAEAAQRHLPEDLFSQPQLPLIDGRGGIWYPLAADCEALWRYTLDDQVVKPYNFTKAITVAAREFMPDVFIILGPGTSLGGAVAQSLVHANWWGMEDRAAFQQRQAETGLLIAMGDEEQRTMAITQAGGD